MQARAAKIGTLILRMHDASHVINPVTERNRKAACGPQPRFHPKPITARDATRRDKPIQTRGQIIITTGSLLI